MQWIYGLFLDLMSYCANALLGIMSTDLTFFEDSVPIVVDLYGIFVAVGWGLLIGNCAFQCMKAMFAGFGFETESPAILLLRTFLFGFLLIFSGDICEIGLSIGKRVIDLLGIPGNITLTMPSDSMFSGLGASWLLVIIIGFILGFQLLKLFFEIAERYVVVAILTLLMPVGLAMGGSKSTKDICTSYIRTYASMVVMMVMNVLFLKLILSALATMPSGALVLPWCLLVVGIAKTARKADQLISKIGLNPAVTGDPLGTGRGLMMAAMAARTIMSVSGKGGGAKGGAGKTGGSSQSSSTSHYSNNRGGNVRNATGGTNVGGNNVGGTNVGGNNMAAGAAYGAILKEITRAVIWAAVEQLLILNLHLLFDLVQTAMVALLTVLMPTPAEHSLTVRDNLKSTLTVLEISLQVNRTKAETLRERHKENPQLLSKVLLLVKVETQVLHLIIHLQKPRQQLLRAVQMLPLNRTPRAVLNKFIIMLQNKLPITLRKHALAVLNLRELSVKMQVLSANQRRRCRMVTA